MQAIIYLTCTGSLTFSLLTLLTFTNILSTKILPQEKKYEKRVTTDSNESHISLKDTS